LLRYLGDLCLAVNAKDALIADLSGHLWLSSGAGEDYDQETFTVLLATGMGAAVEMMNVLDDSRGTSVFLHEGARFVFAAAHIEQDVVLALIFEPGKEHHRIGEVYFSVKRAVEELRKVIIKKDGRPRHSEAQTLGQATIPASPVLDNPLAALGASGLNLSDASSICASETQALLSYQEATSLGLLNPDQTTL
jgi:predicted regulator of Ras-like GTPase activity (Roadblock/LC7/MglB family)